MFYNKCYKGGNSSSDFYVISDPEGCSIQNIINSIYDKDPTSDLIRDSTSDRTKLDTKVIITGDIMDSTHTGMNETTNDFLEYKSHNIRNIQYIVANKIQVCLGNRDLTKLKCIQLFNLHDSATFMTTILSYNDFIRTFITKQAIEYAKTPEKLIMLSTWLLSITASATESHDTQQNIVRFSPPSRESTVPADIHITKIQQILEHSPEIGMLIEQLYTYINFASIIFNKPPSDSDSDSIFILDKSINIENTSCISMFLEYNGKHAYAVDYPSPRDQNNKSYSFYELYKFAFHSTGVNDRFLETIPYEISKICKINFNLDKIKDPDMLKEYKAYIVIFYFKKMLQNNSTTSDNNIDGILYNFFNRSESQMVLFKKNKYLLSHGGITKYCMALYLNSNKGNNIIDTIINQQYDKLLNIATFNQPESTNTQTKSTTLKLAQSTNIQTKPTIPLSIPDTITYTLILEFINNCNNKFKGNIKNILDYFKCTEENKIKSYMFLSISMTEISEESILKLFPSINIKSNYYSPIGPGMINNPLKSGLTQVDDINFVYIHTISVLSKYNDPVMKNIRDNYYKNESPPIVYVNQNDLVKIFGHKPISICSSFYKLNKYNQILINTDISNTFIGTLLNNITVKNNNYLYINSTNQFINNANVYISDALNKIIIIINITVDEIGSNPIYSTSTSTSTNNTLNIIYESNSTNNDILEWIDTISKNETYHFKKLIKHLLTSPGSSPPDRVDIFYNGMISSIESLDIPRYVFTIMAGYSMKILIVSYNTLLAIMFNPKIQLPQVAIESKAIEPNKDSNKDVEPTAVQSNSLSKESNNSIKFNDSNYSDESFEDEEQDTASGSEAIEANHIIKESNQELVNTSDTQTKNKYLKYKQKYLQLSQKLKSLL